MSRALRTTLLLAVFVTFLPGLLLAGTDEYQGDTTIYSGIPTTKTKPNVLIIIDNSKATLNAAPGFEYRPKMSDGSTNVYAQKAGCAGTSQPAQQCYLPWDIYAIDNQGDVSNQVVLANTSYLLENLTCSNNSDVVRKTLQDRGTYSGSGTVDFPNIAGTGSCDQSPKGAVYVLGNYLNYTLSTSITSVATDAPAACKAPNPIVNVSVNELYCTDANKTLANCPAVKISTRTRTGYYQLKQTHTSTDTDKPGSGTNWQTYWNELSPTGTYTSTAWSSGHTYTMTGDLQVLNASGVLVACSTWITTADTSTQKTQRQIMYAALHQAIGSYVGAPNFGAKVYGLNT
ncbi:MAG: hypothetical protein FIB02_12525, partial [Desulfuromonas sp.]|nr:hypothetical protein [Desulfuromonas sp.]